MWNLPASISCSDFLNAVNLHRRQLASSQSLRETVEEGALLKLEKQRSVRKIRPCGAEVPLPGPGRAAAWRGPSLRLLPFILSPVGWLGGLSERQVESTERSSRRHSQTAPLLEQKPLPGQAEVARVPPKAWTGLRAAHRKCFLALQVRVLGDILNILHMHVFGVFV